MRVISQVGLSLLLAGLAAGGVWFWVASGESKASSAGKGQHPRPPALVEIATAQSGSISESVDVVATTRARNAVDIVATSSGLVTAILFEAGQQRLVGDLLVELDAASEQAAVLEAQSELDNARRQGDRARALLKRKLSSSAEVDDLAAQVRVAEARLAAARSRLDKRFVRAPFPGVVGLRNVSVGDYVDSDTKLTTLDDLTTIELDFEVPEKFFAAVARGQRVAASSIAFRDRRFNGTVRGIDTRINTETRSFRVRAELPNPDLELPEGLFMTARLIVAERPNAVLIPQEALIADGEQRYVFIVRERIALRTVVEIGLRADDNIEVQSGIAVGDEVVIRGHQKLRNNSPVQLSRERQEKPSTRPW